VARKHIRILFLDKRNQLIADEVQQVGTVDHTPVYPREVVKRALELSATAIIMVHNHPTTSLSIPLNHARNRWYTMVFFTCRTPGYHGKLGSVLGGGSRPLVTPVAGTTNPTGDPTQKPTGEPIAKPY